jgi:hypothetical protein
MRRILDYAIGVLNFIWFFVDLLVGALSILPDLGLLGVVLLALAAVPLGSVAVFAFTRGPWTGSTSGRHVLALGIFNALPLVVAFLFRDAPATGFIVALLSVPALAVRSVTGDLGRWDVIVYFLPYVLNLAYLAYFAYRLGVSEKTANGRAGVGASRRTS